MGNVGGRVGILAGVIVLAAGLSVETAQAAHVWGGFHWARSQNPFRLSIGNNVSAVWRPILTTTAADWGASSVIDTAIVTGNTKPKACRPSLNRVEVCSASYGNTGWLGIAQVWLNGRHIAQATTKVNDTYFSSAPYNTVAWRNLVMCQEVGHTLGLDHQDENFSNAPLGSCMDYSNDPAPNQHPNAHDYAQLELIYGHLEGGTSASDLPPAMDGIDLATPAQWGRLTHQGNGGRTERYELDFGHGRKVVTFVVWASAFDEIR